MSLEPQRILCKKYYKSRPLTIVTKVFICCIFTKKVLFHYLHVILGMIVYTNFQIISNDAFYKWLHIIMNLFGNKLWRNLRLRNITSYIGTWAQHNIWPWKYAFKIYFQLYRKFFRVMVSYLNSDYYIDWYVCVTWFVYKLKKRQGKGDVRIVSFFQ